jgi:HEAT repeat protein
MLAQVKDYEKNIFALKERIVALEEEQKVEEIRAKEQDKERYRRATLMAGRARKGKESGHRNQVATDVNVSIKEALIHGNFESASDRTIFDKVATDLLDKDVEIRMLAAAELGKMGNKAAVPVLHAAIAQGDGPLVTEIINALIALGDPQSVPIMFDCTQSSNGRVRVCALRGLYKLAPEDEKIRPIFHDGLGDQHPEVRKTAATMLGWLDDADAVPALVQCLTDDDVRVRKAVIAALANIRDKACVGSLIRQLRDDDLEIRQRVLDAIKVISGEQVDFNVSSVGEMLDADIERLKKWWQEIRTGREIEESTPVQDVCEPIAMPGISGIDAAVAKAEAEMAEAERVATARAEAAWVVTETVESEMAAAEHAVAEFPEAEFPEADIPALEPEEVVTTTTEEEATIAEMLVSDVAAMEPEESVIATGEQAESGADEVMQTDEENPTDKDAEEDAEGSSKFKKKGRHHKNPR